MDIEELWERTILQDDGHLPEGWEAELERRRENYLAGKSEVFTLDELRIEMERLRKQKNV